MREPEIALSFAEEQLWLADRAGPTAFPFFDCASSLSIVVRLQNALNEPALRAALDAIVRRHDVLRSRFIAAGGRAERLFGEPSPVSLDKVDLRRIRGDKQSDAVAHALTRHVGHRFDLSRGLLLRAMLLLLQDDDHVLAITVHHIVFDRWSKRVLALELKRIYESYACGLPADLQPLPARYADYVQWQRSRMAGALGGQLLDYWLTQLKGLSDLALPCDRDRPPVASTRSGTCWFTIPAEDVSRLIALGRRARVTLATVLLAIFKLLLARATGTDDVAVGVPLSDRRRPEFERLIGLFMNVVVVRTTVAREITFVALLDRVRRVLADACRNQDMPYGYLLQSLQPQRPLYRVVLNFMPDIQASQMELAELRATPMEIAAERRSLADLSLHIRFNSGALGCRLIYKADLFSPDRMRAFAAQFRMLVSAVLDAPQKAIGTYECPDAAPYRALDRECAMACDEIEGLVASIRTNVGGQQA